MNVMTWQWERLSMGQWVRHPARDRADYVFAAGDGDDSPEHQTYPRGYDGRCGRCFLGQRHTDAEHATRTIGMLRS